MSVRQKESIKTAKARGVKFGRPRITIPNNFDIVARQYSNKEITNKKAHFRELKYLMIFSLF